jgi:2-methylcitrate dehydratase
MTIARELATFISSVSYDDISEAARVQLKIRILDSAGCALGALGEPPMRLLRGHVDDFSASGQCTLVGGGKSSPDRAALYNGALIRYLDFSDSYMAKSDYAHPSDNLGAVLAGAEYAGASGRHFMAALAVAYQVQLRLADEAPVLARGYDHTVQGSYAVACGVSKALGLSVDQTMNAIGMCGTAFNALRVTRTGTLSNWKGLAYANTAFGCTHATFMAMRGLTGPSEVFEGNKGFMHTISGPFQLDWSKENLERVCQTSIKKYNSTIDSQSTVEAMLALRSRENLDPADIEKIDIDVFDIAYKVIGGGEEGDKYTVKTKEQADHSLQYVTAVACIDGRVMPEQYLSARIVADDVQKLLRKVSVRSDAEITRRFPQECGSRITVTLRGGRSVSTEVKDYEGYFSRPMSWETVFRKFEGLSAHCAPPALRREIADCIFKLESGSAADLARALGKVNAGAQSSAR